MLPAAIIVAMVLMSMLLRGRPLVRLLMWLHLRLGTRLGRGLRLWPHLRALRTTTELLLRLLWLGLRLRLRLSPALPSATVEILLRRLWLSLGLRLRLPTVEILLRLRLRLRLGLRLDPVVLLPSAETTRRLRLRLCRSGLLLSSLATIVLSARSWILLRLWLRLIRRSLRPALHLSAVHGTPLLRHDAALRSWLDLRLPGLHRLCTLPSAAILTVSLPAITTIASIAPTTERRLRERRRHLVV